MKQLWTTWPPHRCGGTNICRSGAGETRVQVSNPAESLPARAPAVTQHNNIYVSACNGGLLLHCSICRAYVIVNNSGLLPHCSICRPYVSVNNSGLLSHCSICRVYVSVNNSGLLSHCSICRVYVSVNNSGLLPHCSISVAKLKMTGVFKANLLRVMVPQRKHQRACVAFLNMIIPRTIYRLDPGEL